LPDPGQGEEEGEALTQTWVAILVERRDTFHETV